MASLDDTAENKKTEHVLLKLYNLKYGAPSDPISTIPRTLEEHEELNNLNNKFSKRLDKINVKSQLPSTKGKQVLRNEEDKEEDKNEEEINENKKRAVRKQGEREDSDKE
ncbi:unnamed protein product [Rhizophagus irregularis]|nr:unnamed protein product [Rhizophagus irregularis]